MEMQYLDTNYGREENEAWVYRETFAWTHCP